jgi:hypothetical protein
MLDYDDKVIIKNDWFYLIILFELFVIFKLLTSFDLLT